MLYELRKYDVAAGKVPALLNRFATFSVQKWQEHGFHLQGFWTPDVGGHNHQLIYIWGWESYEERVQKFSTWRANPERIAKWEETEKDGALVRRVNNLLMEPTAFSQLDNGIAYGPSVDTRKPYIFELREYEAMAGKLPAVIDRFGTFTSGCFARHGFRQVGYWTPRMGGSDHQLIYLLAWESYEERTKAFQAFRADPDRIAKWEETERNGPLVERVVNTMMEPTAFSPMR